MPDPKSRASSSAPARVRVGARGSREFVGLLREYNLVGPEITSELSASSASTPALNLTREFVGSLCEYAPTRGHALVRRPAASTRRTQNSRWSSSAPPASTRGHARTQRSHWSSSVPGRVYPGPTVTLECRLPRRYARTQSHPRVGRLHRRARDGQRGHARVGRPRSWPRSAPFASMRSEVPRDFMRFLRAFVPDPRSRERVPVCHGGSCSSRIPREISGPRRQFAQSQSAGQVVAFVLVISSAPPNQGMGLTP
jgi:hypothetical protein